MPTMPRKIIGSLEAGIIVGGEMAAVIAENPTHPLEGQLCSFLSHLSILKFIHPATCQLYTTIIIDR